MQLWPAGLALVLLGISAIASAKTVSLEYLTKAELSTDFKFKKTRVGGLSGLVYNPDKSLWTAVSDDRGRVQEPRFYDLDFQVTRHAKNWKLTVNPKDVFFIHRKGEKHWKKNVLDLEGIALLPWGNYLLSSEGDNNQKPRVMPVLLDVKPDGTWARNFELPEEALPELSGVQKKGIQNNRGGEGLTASADGHFLWVAIESPLVQDKDRHPGQVRIYQYEMTEAWVIKQTQSFYYPLEKAASDVLLSERGVSEIFWLRERELLVMERGLEVAMNHFGYDVKLFQVTLGESGSLLKKELVLDLNQLGQRQTNFEALARGPVLPDGRQTLLVMSDNNFQKSEKTEILLFALAPETK